jgi:hypothetical protein
VVPAAALAAGAHARRARPASTRGAHLVLDDRRIVQDPDLFDGHRRHLDQQYPPQRVRDRRVDADEVKDDLVVRKRPHLDPHVAGEELEIERVVDAERGIDARVLRGRCVRRRIWPASHVLVLLGEVLRQ